jgi:Holliday junction DNA helicase RuvB
MPIKPKTLFKLLQGYVGVFVLDEIHRMPKKDQESMLTILEDGYIQYDNGAKMPLVGAVTFIGATTEPEKVIKPLFDRFSIRPSFEEYTDDQMAQIIIRMAEKIGMHPTYAEALILGRASAGIPRQARTIVFTARDVGSTEPYEVLRVCGITPDGLTEHHIAYLMALDALGKTAGVELLSNYLRLPKELIIDTERLLITRRLIEYSAKGRQMTLEGHITLEKVKQHG